MHSKLLRIVILLHGLSLAGARLAGADESDQQREQRLATERMDLMRTHAQAVRITAPEADFPAALNSEPLFRYDDHTRGYIDGAVWRLGATGRPLAIITTELHPKYLGGGQRIVFDFLSLTDVPFSARGSAIAWTPSGSAVRFQSLPEGPAPGATEALRMVQMKALAGRFAATQEVEGQKVQLRLLDKPIERYQPTVDHDRADGAAFLLCNGRNPAILLFVETDGQQWTYGLGRLSLPSVLTVRLKGEIVWQVEAFSNGSWSDSYTATNYEVGIPGHATN
jgi:hypothetical protein